MPKYLQRKRKNIFLKTNYYPSLKTVFGRKQ